MPRLYIHRLSMYNACMSLKIEQGLNTKNQIIKHAQGLFAKKGYAETRFDSIGEDLGVTSGAMYHHFRNKKDLFDSVVQMSARRIAEKVASSAEAESDIVEGIILGCLTFIKESSSSKYSKIMLEDSISVLGWKRWKEIDEASSEATLVDAIKETRTKTDPHVMARFISGGTNEIALWISHQANKEDAFKKSSSVVRKMVASILSKEAL